MTIFVRIFVVIGLTIMCGINKAQPWINKTNSTSSASTFYDIQRSFNDYWKDKEIDTDECKNAEEGGWQQFKRWENFMIPRVFPTGNFFKSGTLPGMVSSRSVRAPVSNVGRDRKRARV